MENGNGNNGDIDDVDIDTASIEEDNEDHDFRYFNAIKEPYISDLTKRLANFSEGLQSISMLYSGIFGIDDVGIDDKIETYVDAKTNIWSFGQLLILQIFQF